MGGPSSWGMKVRSWGSGRGGALEQSLHACHSIAPHRSDPSVRRSFDGPWRLSGIRGAVWCTTSMAWLRSFAEAPQNPGSRSPWPRAAARRTSRQMPSPNAWTPRWLVSTPSWRARRAGSAQSRRLSHPNGRGRRSRDGAHRRVGVVDGTPRPVHDDGPSDPKGGSGAPGRSPKTCHGQAFPMPRSPGSAALVARLRRGRRH